MRMKRTLFDAQDEETQAALIEAGVQLINDLPPAKHKKKPKRKSKQSQLELLFELQLERAGFVGWLREHKFSEVRNWRFDFAWPDYKIAVELEGGTWKQTKSGRSAGHAHPERFKSDCIKYNEATRIGWQVYRFDGDMVRDGHAIEFVEVVLTEAAMIA